MVLVLCLFWWCSFVFSPPPLFPCKQQTSAWNVHGKSLRSSWCDSVAFHLVEAAFTLEEASALFLRCDLLKCYLKASGLNLLGICYLPPVAVLAPACLGWPPSPQHTHTPRKWGPFCISRTDDGYPTRAFSQCLSLCFLIWGVTFFHTYFYFYMINTYFLSQFEVLNLGFERKNWYEVKGKVSFPGHN